MAIRDLDLRLSGAGSRPENATLPYIASWSLSPGPRLPAEQRHRRREMKRQTALFGTRVGAQDL